jgi:hypothetical protein
MADGTRKGRCCEKCGGKRTFTTAKRRGKLKGDKSHTLCRKCWKSLFASETPKPHKSLARPGRPISELESIFDPGPGEPWDTLANRVLLALGFLKKDVT